MRGPRTFHEEIVGRGRRGRRSRHVSRILCVPKRSLTSYTSERSSVEDIVNPEEVKSRGRHVPSVVVGHRISKRPNEKVSQNIIHRVHVVTGDFSTETVGSTT